MLFVILFCCLSSLYNFFFFFNVPPTTAIYTFPYTTLFRSELLDVAGRAGQQVAGAGVLDDTHRERQRVHDEVLRSEEHTSELQSQFHLVCRLLLEKKKN